MTAQETIELHLAHSPDPDDAFMWWPLFHINGEPPKLDTGRYTFLPVMEDIESLNQRSDRGDYAITAMSCAQYPRVKDIYAMTACGASMGDKYGPKLVAREPIDRQAIVGRDLCVAIPGERTSAFCVLNMMLGKDAYRSEAIPFKDVIDRVADGSFDVGLVIHEGQLTYEEAGLHLIDDVGVWWHAETGLPIPLGVNAIRRDLDTLHGPGTMEEVTGLLLDSVRYALAHRKESVEWAMQYARDMTIELADEFIELYVNAWTLDFGESGRRGVEAFLGRAASEGILPDPGPITFVQSKNVTA